MKAAFLLWLSAIVVADASFALGADICRSRASFCWHESFDDWSNLPGGGGSVWELRNDLGLGAGFRAVDGSLELFTDSGRAQIELAELAASVELPAENWSIRAKLHVELDSTGSVYVGVGVPNAGESYVDVSRTQVIKHDRHTRLDGQISGGFRPNIPISPDATMFVQLDAYLGRVSASLWTFSDQPVEVFGTQVPPQYPVSQTVPYLFAEPRNGPSDWKVWIEDVWISDVPIPIVPEPSTLALVAFSPLGLLLMRRMHRHPQPCSNASPGETT